MPAFSCCSSSRSPSPDLPNSKLVDLVQERDHDATGQVEQVPAGRPGFSSSADDLRVIHTIFASSSLDEATPGPRLLPTQRKTSKQDLTARVCHKDSSGRLQGVVGKLRQRMSRDSLHRRSSNIELRGSMTEDDVQRREELKRALHRRLQDDLLQDRVGNEDEYDLDAMPIKTPNITPNLTWGRSEGFDHTNSNRGSEAAKPSESSRTSETDFGYQDRSHRNFPKRTAVQHIIASRIERSTSGESPDFGGVRHQSTLDGSEGNDEVEKSAKVWSRMYRDCVLAPDTIEASVEASMVGGLDSPWANMSLVSSDVTARPITDRVGSSSIAKA